MIKNHLTTFCSFSLEKVGDFLPENCLLCLNCIHEIVSIFILGQSPTFQYEPTFKAWWMSFYQFSIHCSRDESRDNPDPEIPGFGQIFQSRNPGIEVSGSRDHEIIWKCRHFQIFVIFWQYGKMSWILFINCLWLFVTF